MQIVHKSADDLFPTASSRLLFLPPTYPYHGSVSLVKPQSNRPRRCPLITVSPSVIGATLAVACTPRWASARVHGCSQLDLECKTITSSCSIAAIYRARKNQQITAIFDGFEVLRRHGNLDDLEFRLVIESVFNNVSELTRIHHRDAFQHVLEHRRPQDMVVSELKSNVWGEGPLQAAAPCGGVVSSVVTTPRKRRHPVVSPTPSSSFALSPSPPLLPLGAAASSSSSSSSESSSSSSSSSTSTSSSSDDSSSSTSSSPEDSSLDEGSS